jgi:hypothetical protein
VNGSRPRTRLFGTQGRFRFDCTTSGFNSILVRLGFHVHHAEAGGVLLARAAVEHRLHEGRGAGDGEGAEGTADLDAFVGDELGAAVSVAGQVGGVEGQREAVIGGRVSVETPVFAQQVVADGLGELGTLGRAQVARAAVRERQRRDDGHQAGETGRLGQIGRRQGLDLPDREAGGGDLEVADAEQAGGEIGQERFQGRRDKPLDRAGRQAEPVPFRDASRGAEAGEREQLERPAVVARIALVVQEPGVVLVGRLQQRVDRRRQVFLVIDGDHGPVRVVQLDAEAHRFLSPRDDSPRNPSAHDL